MILLYALLSLTYHTISLDGNLGVFDPDELIYQDASYDSYWQGNELYGLYVTWDRNNLYLGLSYRVQNNAVLIVLDPGRGRGVNDINNLDWYPRNFQFYGMNADILCALWNADISTGGVREILAKDRTQPLRGVEIINNGASGDSSALMVKIPFEEIYGMGNKVPPGVSLKVVALISGSDHTMGGDAIPDNESIGSSSAIRKYIKIVIDSNMDSVPDDSVNVKNATEIVTYPRRVLTLKEFEVLPEKLDVSQPLTVKFSVTDYAFAKIYIVSENGKRVYEKHFESVIPDREYSFVWTPPLDITQGIYFVVVDVNDIIRKKKAFFLKR